MKRLFETGWFSTAREIQPCKVLRPGEAMVRRTTRNQKSRPILRQHIFESLERRALLCDVAAAVNSGVLDVAGGHFDDSIALVYDQERQTIEVHGEGHAVATFPVSEVSSLRIHLLDGNDQISLDPTLKLPTLIDGGSGTDTVTGLSGVDRILNEDGTVDGAAVCIGVECYQDITATPELTTPAHADEHVAQSTAQVRSSRVLSSVHEHDAVSNDTVILNPNSNATSSSVTHLGHMSIAPMVEGLIGSSLLEHHESDAFSVASSFEGDAATESSSAHATQAGIGDYASAEHSMGSHALGGLSEEVRKASTNPEFATKSPYKTECPTSSPVGAPAVASSSSPTTLGGEVANTVAGAP